MQYPRQFQHNEHDRKCDVTSSFGLSLQSELLLLLAKIPAFLGISSTEDVFLDGKLVVVAQHGIRCHEPIIRAI